MERLRAEQTEAVRGLICGFSGKYFVYIDVYGGLAVRCLLSTCGCGSKIPSTQKT